MRLRTRFLLSMALVTAALTTTSLLLVRRSILNNTQQSIAANLNDSVNSFQDFRRERETILTSNVALLADLPLTRAIMTSTDPVTIQDASQDVWQHARSSSDLFVLVDRGGKVVALHTKTPGFTREAAEKYFQQSLDEDSGDSSHWWFGEHHLYQTFVQPIYRGSTTEGTLLGFLVIGYEINNRLAGQVSKVAGGPVAFSYGNEVVATTLDASQVTNPNLQSLISGAVQGAPRDINVGKENFLATSLLLSGSRSTPVRLGVLGSYDQATKFINKLNRYLLLLGLAAVLIGSGLVFFLSHTFTRPLGNLVAGVRALEAGDFHHPLDSSYGRDEVAELTRAFDRMRASLLKSQRDLLESEQLATIGRMASSISHDLRHSLAAIVANSEFLCDPHLTPNQREELYQEVRTGVNLMTDLIDSLLEFARTRESLTPVYASVAETIHRAVHAVRLHPRHHNRSIDILCSANVAGWFDPRKLERALYNLLLNACEAAPAVGGLVEVTAGELDGSLTISVADNGPGIADSIRDKLFHPFVSYGKENGTGLGLAVVQKIVQDHGGEIFIERTAQGRTIFRIALPGRPKEAHRGATEIQLPSLVAAPREVSNHSISHPEM
ncbi:MAG TPA: HAMP domain-containing sensor histidine kinase [Candidatus Solibacter sp.]|nr:HAMP domain-containing sensor histidine kinase [Candidatus Solibacter sp.]